MIIGNSGYGGKTREAAHKIGGKCEAENGQR